MTHRRPPTPSALAMAASAEAAWMRMASKIADAAARRLQFTPDERQTYLAAILAAPATYPGGRPVPHHDIGMRAVARLKGEAQERLAEIEAVENSGSTEG